jgi:Plavaka transposase
MLSSYLLLGGLIHCALVRCTANARNLDDGGVRRTQEHREYLVTHFEAKLVWDGYGIVPGVTVSADTLAINNCLNSDVVKPFTNAFPRAEIYTLLAPDILHQIIKGCFKDHLVKWIGEYLELKYGKTAANVIMDDIDLRYAFPCTLVQFY